MNEPIPANESHLIADAAGMTRADDQPHAPVFLVGFMGAGKTTVGQALALALRRRFIDLDRIIEANEARTVEQIFSESGEAEFRRLERAAIESCRGLQHVIVALGGGAYIAEENRHVLRGIGVTVWLDCPLEVCLERIRGDTARPLLRRDEEMQSLLEKRRPAYALADVTVQTGRRAPDEIVQEICCLLKL